MLISPHEQERLLIHVAAGLARERRARGLRLNYPEAVALITSFLLEGARDGRTVVELMASGRRLNPIVGPNARGLTPGGYRSGRHRGSRGQSQNRPRGRSRPRGALAQDAGPRAHAPG